MRRTSIAERHQITYLKKSDRISNAALATQLGVTVPTMNGVSRRHQEMGP